MVMALTSGAQLCTGSLGDPVVHITFGSGSNPGPALAAATTNYTYVSNDCPNDGSYTVRNATANCFSSTWHNLAEDHTPGDANGYFMLVNANVQPGDFYVGTVQGLCANTTYEFAAWIANVLKPQACSGSGTDPNLTFKIETTGGVVLATYNTGNIPEEGSATWRQFGTFFQTPAATTSVIIRLTNNAPGGCGNDIALDDITFRPCGPNIGATLSITGGTTAAVCEGDTTSYLLRGQYPGGYNNPAFQWQVSVNGGVYADIPGANSNDFLRTFTGPGRYSYRLSMSESENLGSSNCRVASNIITIEVNTLPVVQAADTVNACHGADVTLSASGATTYLWTGPNGFASSQPQPVLARVDQSNAGLYRIQATSDKGCSVNDSILLQVRPAVTAAVTGNQHICEGSGAVLTASGGDTYLWTPAAGLSSATIANPVASPADTTTYRVRVTSQYGCSDSMEFRLNVWKKPLANAGPDKITREGLPVVLEGSATGTNVSFYWTPPTGLSDDAILRPTAVLSDDGRYVLHAVSNVGCGSHSDEVLVKVYKKVIVPNAFSPNNDGINDRWAIPALQTYPDPEITVFNRYGQPVFRSKGYGAAWDGRFNGKLLPVGTYYYVIDLRIAVEPPLTGWVFIVY